MLVEYRENEEEEIIDSFVDQPNLSEFLANEVRTEDDDGSSLNDETATQLLIVTLFMVALLNKAIS